MSLYEEASVHLIIQELPNLQYLNGIEIQRAEIIRQRQLKLQEAAEDNLLKGDLPLEQIKETDEEEIQSAAPLFMVQQYGGVNNAADEGVSNYQCDHSSNS